MRRKIARVVGGRCRGVFCRDRNPMDVGVDVDTGGVWVRHPELRPCARTASVLLIPRCHSGLHKGNRESTEAASAGEYPTKAVSQTGTRTGAPPMMSTQSPGTKFTIGHEAPLDDRPPRPAASSAHYTAGGDQANSSHGISRSTLMSRGPRAPCSLSGRLFVLRPGRRVRSDTKKVDLTVNAVQKYPE